MIVKLLFDRKQAVRNRKTGLITIEWLMKGTIIDHPNGHKLVRAGNAEPVDKESMEAIGLPESRLDQRRQWQQGIDDMQKAARDRAANPDIDDEDEDDDE